jgi:hypothetical protein
MEASQTVLPFKLSTTDEWLTAHRGLDLSRTDGSRPGGAQGGSAVGGKRIRAKTSPAGSFAASRRSMYRHRDWDHDRRWHRDHDYDDED